MEPIFKPDLPNVALSVLEWRYLEHCSAIGRIIAHSTYSDIDIRIKKYLQIVGEL